MSGDLGRAMSCILLEVLGACQGSSFRMKRRLACLFIACSCCEARAAACNHFVDACSAQLLPFSLGTHPLLVQHTFKLGYCSCKQRWHNVAGCTDTQVHPALQIDSFMLLVWQCASQQHIVQHSAVLSSILELDVKVIDDPQLQRLVVCPAPVAVVGQ